jgi:hypothetical protein
MKVHIRGIISHVLIITMLLAPVAGLLAGCGNGGDGIEEDPGVRPVAGPVIDGEEGFHVIVAGGEPEGVAAALAASRNGMRTLLVEKGDVLGGLFTLGMLAYLDLNERRDGVFLTQGIFQEFYDAVGIWNTFDVQQAKDWFTEVCQGEPNLTVMLNTDIIAPVMVGNTIAGLEVKERGGAGTQIFRSLAVIDATVDGDVAAAAGAPYTIGGEDHGAHWTKQGVTLVFEVSGVDWDAVIDHLRGDGDPNSGADDMSAWGYNAAAARYVPADGNMRFRGPNIARQYDGNVLLNALVIFGVDALDPESLLEGIDRGRSEIPHLVRFMRDNFAGFENAALVGHAPRLYVRETRHFIGEYRLTITDVLENRDHWDRIGHGKYPVDIQATTLSRWRLTSF